MRLPLLPILLAVALTSPARAELSPQVYKDMQDAAPEAVRVKVTSVDRAFTQGRTKEAELVQAKAKVLEVTRTATGITVGKEISLRYVHDPLPEDMAGPGPVPIVERTAEYQAFLRGGEQGSYGPAARRASLVQVKAAETGATGDAPERVSDVIGSPVTLASAGVLLLLVLGGLAAFFRGRGAKARDEDDPEEAEATQFRVAPVLRKPED